MRVAVVSDDALSRAIDRLAGEWNNLTDGEVEIVPLDEGANLVAAAADADLIVFASRRLGELCEAGVLRPLRNSVIESDDLRYEDFLPLVRDHEIVYAQRPMALPLGCPTPLLMLPPNGEPVGLVAPDDDIELALAYLAWAAPHASHRSRVATLFDADDFRPRIAEPPFVRALESFVAALGDGPGRFAWPAREEPAPEGLRPQRLPGVEEVYNTLAEVWEEAAAGDERATLLASSGRLIAVTESSRNAATAFRYAAWLAGPDNAREVSQASDAVASCRGSFARSGDPWRDSADRELAKAFAAAQAEALRTTRFLLTPRLPGADEYLAVLASKVRDAVDGEPAAQALAEVATEWEEISRASGRDRQEAAYKRSLNAARFLEERR